MENLPKIGIKTKVVHSSKNNSWNVVGTTLGAKYKVARIPYAVSEIEVVTNELSNESKNIAEYLSFCLNNEDVIRLIEPVFRDVATFHPNDNFANKAMKELRNRFDETYFWCGDCDGLVCKQKECCLNNKPETIDQ